MITQDCNLSSCAAGGVALAAEPSSGVWSLPVFSGGAESLGPSPGSGYTPNNPSLEFSNSGPASASLAAAFIPNLGAGEHTSINRFVIRGSLSHYNETLKSFPFSSYQFGISQPELNTEDTVILSLEPGSNLGYSSLRPLSPLLQSSISRDPELLPGSTDDNLDPKSFLTPLNTVQSLTSVIHTEEVQTTPAFTITPLFNLDEERQEPDSTTLESCLGEYFYN